MLRNYFETAYRNLVRDRNYTAINVTGLAVGMAVFLLIAQYVRFERSYEDFIPDRANIYRVSLETFRSDARIDASAENYPSVGPALLREIPQVTSFARLYNLGYKNNVIITNESARPNPITFKQHRFLYADSSFLSMMGYEMLSGNPGKALGEPSTAVISEKYARLYFPKSDPIGQTLHMHDDDFNDEWVKVTGVYKELPENTHLKFDILFSYKTLLSRGGGKWIDRFDQNWTRADMYTFVCLNPGTDPKSVEAVLPRLISKYKPQLQAANEKQLLRLQPLGDIHLHSDLAEEPEANGNGRVVFFLSLIGIFVLLIAWINFINISTAKAVGRAKEVGVRKVIGASRIQIILRFLLEAALINLVALIIACGLVILAGPAFTLISGISLDSSYLIKPWFFGLVIGLWILGSLLSGIYPAWVLSSFRPVTALKEKLKSSPGGIFLRKGLVVGQFMASIGLIAGTLIVYHQVKYMLGQDLGISISQVLVMDRPGIAPSDNQDAEKFKAEIDLFRQELKKNPSIEAVSNTVTVPGMLRENRATIKRWGDQNNDSIIVSVNSMDFEFLQVFKMQLLAGRAFSRDFPKDPDTSVILTASAVRSLGFKKPEEAIGKVLNINEWGGVKPIIVGVVNDYHQVSFKKPLEPTIFTCDNYEGEYYSIRLRTDHLPQTMDHIRKSWEKAFPGNPFEYFFLDDYFNRQYANERKFGQLFTCFSLLAILISCLGLFGLSAYTASQRVKEIGIRKVLGASSLTIAYMLSVDFLKLVALSIVLASPITWIIMNNWLSDFAYRIRISWWIFGMAGVFALIIAMLTVSFQAIRAAQANPVKSLRNE
jgi:putative ABC transport system permease protein